MDVHKNEKTELRLWAKDDIVPGDLQELCKQAATSINKLQEQIKNLEADIKIKQSVCETIEKELTEINEKLKKQIEELETALGEIVTESGKVDITNWPAQQQVCQAIAQKALEYSEKSKPRI